MLKFNRLLPWQCIITPPLTGEENMALDKAIFKKVTTGEIPPTIRFYRWKPSCISLGYFQKPHEELNLAEVEKDGIDWVKRITGGRAVYHIDELTYSISAKNDREDWCSRRDKSYFHINKALLNALKNFSPNFALSRAELRFNLASKVKAPCFSSPARSEIELDGKKIVGSAQRRNSTGFLQHGSILLSQQHKNLVQYLRLSKVEKDEYLKVLEKNSISLDQIDGFMGFESNWIDSFAKSFCEELGASVEYKNDLSINLTNYMQKEKVK